MKLLLIFAAILAFSLAEEEKKTGVVEDSQAEASANLELMKEGADLTAAASTYNSYVPPSQRPPQWNAPNYVPPQNSWQPPKPIQPGQTGVPAGVQSDYYWSSPVSHPPTTTTPVSVIKNEHYIGDNGNYRYEYKIADGTWVGEEGYFIGKEQTEENLVKKGWYSFVGADGKTYTTTYWADRTGFHAYGDHLPTPPPAYQAAQEANKYGPQNDEYPTQTQAPAHVHYPTQTQAPAHVHYPTQTQAPVHIHYPTQTPAPVYYPTNAPYVPPPQQGPYVPPPQAPYVPFPPQQAPYVPPQPTYQPPVQQYYPPQQNLYPQYPTNQV